MSSIIDAFKEMDRKMLLLIVGGLGGLILLIIILSILGKSTGGAKISYDDVEKKLVVAAQKYYSVNSGFLPREEKSSSTVSLSNLVEGEYIKPLNKYLRDGSSCDAKVVVTKTALDYDYIPYLYCGDKYTSIELYKKILEDNVVVGNGAGLYNLAGEKTFRGEVKNNYVLLNKKNWRILRIDENNNIVLMSMFKTETAVWDDRYNSETNTSDGINDYNVSRIKDYVNSKYYSGDLLTDSEKSKVALSKACIGSRSKNAFGSLRSIECSELSDEELPIRLLTVGEYLTASIDPNCKTIEDRGCTNYNFMHDFSQSFWTITKGQKNSSYIYSINTSGVLEVRANGSRQVRYVILLSPKAFYLSGSGTYEDPYIIK